MSDANEYHHQHGHHEGDTCQCRSATVTVGQTLDEMDFERGIWSAAIYNDIHRIKDFIQKGDVDRRDNGGYTALHYAARHGHNEICRLLLDANCNVNAKTKGGATPLHRASMMGHKNIVDMLLRSNAKVDLQDEDGQTALHRSAAKGLVEISKSLIHMSNDLKSIQDKKGRIPYDLIPSGNEELKRLLAI